MTDLEKRVYNLEVALMSLHTLTSELLPPANLDAVEEMMNDFFYSSNELSAFTDGTDFKSKD